MAAEKPVVLTIRAETLDGSVRYEKQKETSRDPFNWQAEQLDKIKKDEKPNEIDPLAGLTLTGIFFDSKAPLAFINGKAVGVGERIEEFSIVEIKKDSVTAAFGGRKYIFRLAPETIDLGIKKGTGPHYGQ